MNAIALSIFSSRIEAVCDEMGAVLKRVAFSPNIKDRLDYSCAVFDAAGELCAQAAHIPVHLGSMAYAMQDIVNNIRWHDRDMLMLNDPYLGGTHLPDVTVIAPVYVSDILMGFVVNRAHHADIGADSPGSMPLSSNLHEEGQVIPPTKIVVDNCINAQLMADLTDDMRNQRESRGDFEAQISANRRGVERLKALIQKTGVAQYQHSLRALNDYAEALALAALQQIADGDYEFEDVMDDDGMGQTDIPIRASLRVHKGRVVVDFAGTARQVKGNINCPLSVAAAAVFYVFRCLMPAQTPACAGTFRLIQLKAPEGCLLNAIRPAAVAAGNVETSSRVVDVVMGALAKALPEKIPAASHGSMNNVAMGSIAHGGQAAWDYYETIGGGMGASRQRQGLSGVQTHMTNTLNTPVESLEMNYPLRVKRYQLRTGSGGAGAHKGGDGIIREFEFLEPTQVTVLSERRKNPPWGLNGGEPGMSGNNQYAGQRMPGKFSITARRGEVLSIETPGGGGYGKSR